MKITSDFQTHGLMANFWNGVENPLVNFHRHNEIELVALGRGNVVQTTAGRSIPIPPRSLGVFWAGFSHRMTAWEPYGEIWTLAIPLTAFLAWPLPQPFVHRLLHGAYLHEPDAARWETDLSLMKQWHEDIHGGATTEMKETVLLEVQARLRRLSGGVDQGAPLQEGGESERVTSMLFYIAENYREPLTVADIAKSANITPSYAMELFRTSCGVSMMQYVNDQRIAHARRMLATTDAKILDVAMDSGFGSESQFYNLFRRVCGQTPRDYARINSNRSAQR